MPKVKEKNSNAKIRPALNPEVRENRMISMAMDLAEEQLQNGTASSQIITEFLKRGSEKARLENEKLKEENQLLRAKTEALQSQQKVEELYLEAINAMKKYTGNGGVSDDEENIFGDE